MGYCRLGRYEKNGKTRGSLWKPLPWHARSTPLVTAYRTPRPSPADRTPSPFLVERLSSPRARRSTTSPLTLPVMPRIHLTWLRSQTRAATFNEILPSRTVPLCMRHRTTMTPLWAFRAAHPMRFLLPTRSNGLSRAGIHLLRHPVRWRGCCSPPSDPCPSQRSQLPPATPTTPGKVRASISNIALHQAPLPTSSFRPATTCRATPPQG